MARFQGAQISEAEQWGDDYGPSLIEAVYEHDKDWNSWSDVIDWIEEHADDYDVSPEAIESMLEDLHNLKELGVDFTSDPAEAYELAHESREM
ncbi:MAG: hypothetical protein A2010_06495 [Nitrospirae bacterium GWD2_57_9]|nr:MAG: hypothetical protein A2010_06495 [Nitrospirae bacterium GWD2_57_9]